MVILPFSSSQVARITGVSHWCPALFSLPIKTGIMNSPFQCCENTKDALCKRCSVLWVSFIPLLSLHCVRMDLDWSVTSWNYPAVCVSKPAIRVTPGQERCILSLFTVIVMLLLH
jgi:hypothetical protein